MWPSIRPAVTLKLDLPPEVKTLAGKLSALSDRALDLAWWHGLETGLVWGFVAGVLATALVVALYRRRS